VKALAVSIVVIFAIAPPTGAQGPVTPPPATPAPNRASALKANEYAVAVTGCIRGKHLRASDLEGLDSLYATLRASEFILQGPRALLQQIKDSHDGHYDRIEGIVMVPATPNNASSTVTTKKIGKTNVTLGGREEGKAYVQDPPKPLTLKVASLTHLQKGCAGH